MYVTRLLNMVFQTNPIQFWSGFIPVNRGGLIYRTLPAISPTPTIHLAGFKTSSFSLPTFQVPTLTPSSSSGFPSFCKQCFRGYNYLLNFNHWIFCFKRSDCFTQSRFSAHTPNDHICKPKLCLQVFRMIHAVKNTRYLERFSPEMKPV